MFLFYLVLFFLTVIFVEGITELVVKSEIFSGARGKISNKSEFFSKVVSCGYCFSVWAAFLPSLVASLYLFSPLKIEFYICFMFLLIVLHRTSNMLHNFNDKHLDKFYNNYKKDL